MLHRASGEVTQHCKSRVLRFLHRFQHHPATPARCEALSDAGGPWPGGLDYGLPHQQTTVRQTAGQPPKKLCFHLFLFTLDIPDFHFNLSTSTYTLHCQLHHNDDEEEYRALVESFSKVV